MSRSVLNARTLRSGACSCAKRPPSGPARAYYTPMPAPRQVHAITLGNQVDRRSHQVLTPQAAQCSCPKFPPPLHLFSGAERAGAFQTLLRKVR